MSELWVCGRCGGFRIDVDARVNPNTDEILKFEKDECYCQECKQYTFLMTEEEYESCGGDD
jgi:hypothetical protein